MDSRHPSQLARDLILGGGAQENVYHQLQCTEPAREKADTPTPRGHFPASSRASLDHSAWGHAHEDKKKDLTLTANYSRGFSQLICHLEISKYSVSQLFQEPVHVKRLVNVHIFNYMRQSMDKNV